ncbi:MAG: YihY/virulence factor BrkB family protein [Lachnospiraceae bacterium]|nr:YihY/virulence factor BrkB family protein [Lachnospiraceae bacterium]
MAKKRRGEPLTRKVNRASDEFFRKCSSDHIVAFSSQTAFFMLMSIFPLLMLLLNLTQFLPYKQSDVVALFSSFMPQEFMKYVERIIEDLYEKSQMPIFSVSIFLFLWTAAKGMYAIGNGLDSIYDCEEYRNFFKGRFIGIFYTLIFMVFLVVLLCLFVFGNTIIDKIIKAFPGMNPAFEMILNLRSAFGVIILFVFFCLLFSIVPHKKNKPFSQMWGAAFSAAGWIILSIVFRLYFDKFSGFSYMYGSITTVLMAMIWLYFCIYIIFLGGEVNCYLARRRERIRKKTLK